MKTCTEYMIVGCLMAILWGCSESSSTGQSTDVDWIDVSPVGGDDGSGGGNGLDLEQSDGSADVGVDSDGFTDTGVPVDGQDGAIADIANDIGKPEKDITTGEQDGKDPVDLVDSGEDLSGDVAADTGGTQPVPQSGAWTETFDRQLNMDSSATTAAWGGGALTVDHTATFGDGGLGDFLPEVDTDLVVDNGPLHFGNFVIPAGVTVRLVGDQPAIILATGSVEIAGTLQLDGGQGLDATSGGGGIGGVGGPGGGNGGNGTSGGALAGTGASGVGAGMSGANHAAVFGIGFGGGGGHAAFGKTTETNDPWSGAGGMVYGTDDLLISINGGSGGGAGGAFDGSGAIGPNLSDGMVGFGDRPAAGGGGGGGAVLLIAKGSVQVSGMISAIGGTGGNGLFSPAGSCCQPGPGPGCDGSALEVCACELNPNCCVGEWGPECIDAAEICGACLGNGGAGGGGSGGSIGLFSAATVDLWGGKLDVRGGSGGYLVGAEAPADRAGDGSDGRIHVGAVGGFARWVHQAIPTPEIVIDYGPPLDPFETFTWVVEGTQTFSTDDGQLLVNKLVIPQGSMLVAEGSKPLDIVVSGNAVIDGVIVLNGKDGKPGNSGCCNSPDAAAGGLGGQPGPGGFEGGQGGAQGFGQDGLGPAGGKTSALGKQVSGGGGGGGHATAGQNGGCPAGGQGGVEIADLGGLDGGSGGGGASASSVLGFSGGGGGGGGGGSIRLLVGGTLSGHGVIYSDGGKGGSAVGINGTFGSGGGGGAGGKIVVKAGNYDADLSYYARGGDGGFIDENPDVCWAEDAAFPRSGGKGSNGLISVWSQGPVGLVAGADASALSTGYDPWLGNVAYTGWIDTGVESPEYSPSATVVWVDQTVSGMVVMELQGKNSLTGPETEWVTLGDGANLDKVNGHRYFRLKIMLEPDDVGGLFGISEVVVQWTYL